MLVAKDHEVIGRAREAKREAMLAAKDHDPIGPEKTRARMLVAKDHEVIGRVKEAKLEVMLVARDPEAIGLVKEVKLGATSQAHMLAATALALGQAILENMMTRLDSSKVYY